MKYILAAHGRFAEACVASCEMITGSAQNLFSVAFTEDMSKEDLISKYEEIISKNTGEEFIFLTDLAGGTPYNAARMLFQEKEEVQGVLAGLSLQMTIPLSLGENISNLLKSREDLITYEGRDMESEIKVTNQSNQVLLSEKCENGIVQIRIDERLIHGQVASMWIGNLSVNRVMIIDDNVVKSEMEKAAIRAACPKNIKLSILTAKNAAKRIKEGIYQKDRVLILIKTPKNAKKLYDEKVNIPHVNLGNMSKQDNRKMLKKSVYISKDELSDLLYLEQHNVLVTAQMVPSEEKKNILEFIKMMEVEV